MLKEETTAHSRREFLAAGAAAAATFASVPLAASATETRDPAASLEELTRSFDSLPGEKALKIYAPEAEGRPRLLVQSNSNKMLFVASAIKTFVLCEALRQADSPDMVHTLEHKDVVLNDTIWSLGSPTFNPPDVTGIVSERTTLEAMITRSDNTATDMAFKLVGANNVRKLLEAAGLESTLVPESTRAFTGHLFGADDYKTITWERLLNVAQGPIVRPFLNNVETLASSADDFVSY